MALTPRKWPVPGDEPVPVSDPKDARANPFVILGQAKSPNPAIQQKRRSLIPAIPLQDGEQYRFHFDMSNCIGCKCCEVACAEQNNLPPNISWRRVGEVEGGSYPNTQRLHMSMGCNHCLEPSCLAGCPVDAFRKDKSTGLVLHSAELCIGCEYCIWNCPYGVPAFNEERGVVGKCDMCSGRILQGLEPACVTACPQEAIQVEIVNVEAWRREYQESANAPGLPSAENTISTTRITLPANLPVDLKKADYFRVRPEKPHHALVGMTVLTQLSVGAFSLVWLFSLLAGTGNHSFAVYSALSVGLISFLVSPMHLGRPIYAYRAMKMWKRSWLSREIVLLSAFGLSATVYSLALWADLSSAAVLGGITTLLGFGGITATSFIYLVPARPAWNSKYTILEFVLTALTLGSLFALTVRTPGRWLVYSAVAASAAQLMIQMMKFLWLANSEEFELSASSRLLSKELRGLLLWRFALLIVGGITLPLLDHPLGALMAGLASELLGRHLFFVSVVPRNVAMSFFGSQQETA
ncbi:MAG: dimethyl sulfoxide reductase anchor subunit [Acidobacteria bacterium]|nr:dimethyl sulfoxide reductase anchor subunit [Acidobacteriota bacterium]